MFKTAILDESQIADISQETQKETLQTKKVRFQSVEESKREENLNKLEDSKINDTLDQSMMNTTLNN